MDASFVCEDTPKYLPRHMREIALTEPLKDLVEHSEKEYIEYPESDGKPMAETDRHRDFMFYLIQTLKEVFPQSYVSGNLCLYYKEREPKRWLSPDVLVALQGKSGQKRIYKTWEEPPIDFVVEVSSRKTKREDYHKKMKIYAEILKIPNYIIFDPEKPENFNVYQLIKKQKKYRLCKLDEMGRYHIKSLNLFIQREKGILLRLLDQDSNPILTQAEKSQKNKEKAEKEQIQRKKAEGKVKKEKLHRRQAEEKAKKEELSRKQAEQKTLQAEKQVTQAKAKAELAEKEKLQLQEQWEKEKKKVKLEGELENIEKLYQMGMLTEENYQILKNSLQI